MGVGGLLMGCSAGDDSANFDDLDATGADSVSDVATGSTTSSGNSDSSGSGTTVTSAGDSGGTSGAMTGDAQSATGSGGNFGGGGSGGGGGPPSSGGMTSGDGSGGTGGGSNSGGSGGNPSTGGTGGATTTQGSGGSDSAGGSGGMPIVGSVEVVEDCGFSACGGEIANSSWQFSRACFEETHLMARLVELCETVELLEASGEISGTLSFETDSFVQDAEIEMTTTIWVPPACVISCDVTALALQAELPGTRCQARDGGGCTCNLPMQLDGSVEGDYTSNGDELTLAGETSEYCAGDGSFKYVGTAESVPFVYEAIPW